MSVPTEELRTVLERELSAHFGEPVRVETVARRASEYASSFGLEELDIGLTGRPPLALVFKRLGPAATTTAARGVKPPFLADPRREIEVYRSVLAGAGLGTATCYGAVCDPPAGRYWLFLERVVGDELYKVGEFETWLAAARWLAAFHTRFAGRVTDLVGTVPLLRWMAAELAAWVGRARSLLPSGPIARRFERIERHYDRVTDRLLTAPPTLLHGDFYPANVLVGPGPRVCPVDWELAGAGPGLLNLAALVAGKWPEDRRRDIALAYHAALPENDRGPAAAFLDALDHARLHVAVQWVGWAAGWSPPASQAHDWAAEAVELADRLDL